MDDGADDHRRPDVRPVRALPALRSGRQRLFQEPLPDAGASGDQSHRPAARQPPWLGGAEYGIADIATYPWIRNVPALLGADAAAKYPNAMRWVGVINERPAVKKALAAVEDVRARTTAFDKAEAGKLDKVFGRGAYAAA